MKKTWIVNVNQELAEEIRGNFKSSALVRERLTAILNERIASKRNEVTAKTSYESPSWAFYQADALGYERALNEVISLISNDSGEK